MKPARINRSMLLLAGIILTVCHSAAGTEAISCKQEGTVLSLENAATRLEYDLALGLFQVINKVDRQTVIKNAGAGVNGQVLSGPARRDWTVEPVQDDLGTGRSLRIQTKAEPLEPSQIFTLYEGRGELVLQWGVHNKGREPIRIKELVVVKGATVWPDVQAPAEVKTLDGLAGWDHFQTAKTRVEDGNTRWSYNNLFYTLKASGVRRSLVFGGLSYEDFATVAAIKAGVMHLSAEDPVGRRVDPGEDYLPGDRYVINASLADPFAALENYGRVVATANALRINPYTFPTVCAWYAYGYFHGKGGTYCDMNPDAGNNTPTCVREIEIAGKAGFLNYAPVAIRLVPDTYNGNTEQGWWDDEHWRTFGHYREPYETSVKFCQAVLDRGGLPFTYVQAGMPSDDYAAAFPGHMMGNDISQLQKPHRHHLPYISFDYTDPDFQRHLGEVWGNVRKAGMRGVMFDYPETAWRHEGGFEDGHATCAAAYRKVYQIARQGLGPMAYIQERLLGEPNTNSPEPDETKVPRADGIPVPVLDNTVGIVDSQRVMGDTVAFSPEQVRRCGLRWYKCRRLFAYDMDAKAVSTVRDERRAMLTMAYVVSGRLLLGTSFANMSPEMVHDLSRTFPYHTEPRSARPIDLLLRDNPMVYDFDVTEAWHQLCLYNSRSTQEGTEVTVPLSGDRAGGALGLDPAADYYLYDFWNDRFVGRLKGSGLFRQTLRGGEARMLSVHKAQAVPQWISTNRHLMQGYLDLMETPAWHAAESTLVGTSKVIAKDAYEVVMACNGRVPLGAECSAGEASVAWKDKAKGIAALTLRVSENATVQWRVRFR